MKKMNNGPDDFTLRSRISVNCMYITTRGNETRKSLCHLTRARGHSPRGQRWGVCWLSSLTGRRDTRPYDNLKESTWQLFKKQNSTTLSCIHCFRFTLRIFEKVKYREGKNEPSRLVLAFAFGSHTCPFCKCRQTEKKKAILMQTQCLVGRQTWSPRRRQ